MQNGVARHPDRSPEPLTTRENHSGVAPRVGALHVHCTYHLLAQCP